MDENQLTIQSEESFIDMNESVEAGNKLEVIVE